MKKSQKALKLEKTYNERIEVMLYLYEHGFYTRDKTLKEAKTITNEIETLIDSALHFNMISMKDYEALWNDIVVEGKYNYCNLLDIIYDMEV